jgi:hypothetical protein
MMNQKRVHLQAGPVLVQAQKPQVSLANTGLLQKMSRGKFFFFFNLLVWMTPLLMAQTITTGTIASPTCAGVSTLASNQQNFLLAKSSSLLSA